MALYVLEVCEECLHVKGTPHEPGCSLASPEVRLRRLEQRVTELESMAHPSADLSAAIREAILKREQELSGTT